MGRLLRLNAGLYTAGNPTLFTGDLAWDSTGKLNWAETVYDESWGQAVADGKEIAQ